MLFGKPYEIQLNRLFSAGFLKPGEVLIGSSISGEVVRNADFPGSRPLLPTSNKPEAPGWYVAGCCGKPAGHTGAATFENLCSRIQGRVN